MLYARITSLFFILILPATAVPPTVAPVAAASARGPDRSNPAYEIRGAEILPGYVEWIYVTTDRVGGNEWVDPNGTLHIRGRSDFGFLKGDILGDAVITYNARIDLQAGTGNAWGTILVYEFNDERRAPPLWTGTWRQTLKSWKVIGGSLYAFGDGPYLGLQLRGVKCGERPDGILNNGGYLTQTLQAAIRHGTNAAEHPAQGLPIWREST
jgi:hypothetical protein